MSRGIYGRLLVVWEQEEEIWNAAQISWEMPWVTQMTVIETQ